MRDKIITFLLAFLLAFSFASAESFQEEIEILESEISLAGFDWLVDYPMELPFVEAFKMNLQEMGELRNE